MKKQEINVGGYYTAKISGNLVVVRVDATEDCPYGRSSAYRGRGYTAYHCTNLTTGRKVVFKSAAKFRGVAVDPKAAKNPSRAEEAAKIDADTACLRLQADVSVEAVEPDTDLASLFSPAPEDASRPFAASAPSATTALRSSPAAADARAADPADGWTPEEVEEFCHPETVGDRLRLEERLRADNRDIAHANCATPPVNGSLHAKLVAAAPQPSQGVPHVIVRARAGTGKTTTLVEGLKAMRGLETKITPSPQQAAVWDQLASSKGVRSVGFVAFNKSIATELQARVPQGCDAMTMHSMGFKAVRRALGNLEPNSYVVQDIICELLEKDIRDLRRDAPTLLKATEDLVSLCKMNLVGHNGTPLDDEALTQLTTHYEVDLADDRTGKSYRAEVFELVPRVLERCKTPQGRINFDDMIWLPVVLDLPVFQYDLLLVDEAQDLNRCQQALARLAGKRLVLCGDDRQAIYGFAGADAESLPRMERELGATPAGCVVLPLTVTRRCGKAIVREAQKQVPDFEAHESNPEGLISEAEYSVRKRSDGSRQELPWEDTYCALCRPGDMVLCRVNAPLVSNCFRFLKRGIKATIQGRDVGQGLISTVTKLSGGKDAPPMRVEDFVAKLSDWHAAEERKEQAKRNPSEMRLIGLRDRYDCLICFTDGARTTADVVKKIQAVFTDDKTAPGVRFSSIHCAKGLEAPTVFFLVPEDGPCPHPMAKSPWQRGQEWNIWYVGVTRAISHLIWVS